MRKKNTAKVIFGLLAIFMAVVFGGCKSLEVLLLVRIMTLEENCDAAESLPTGTSVAYYQIFDRMLADLDGASAVMLRWSELPTSYQLLIPFDAQGNKVPEFRSPHLYHAEASELDFTQIVDALSSQE